MATSDHTIRIPLTKGYVTFVDECDADLSNLRWKANGVRYLHVARNVWDADRKCHTVLIHRVIMQRMVGRPLKSDEQVDHINGDALDNRRANLRLATGTENARNKRIAHNNVSGYKGVSPTKNGKKWHAQICVNRKVRHLGEFDTPEEAYEVYKWAAKEAFGEFAADEARSVRKDHDE